VIGVAHRADAYPQYQLSHDATCIGCHLSPAGGGVLSESGFVVAEQESWKGGDPEPLHGLSVPSWLRLGGDHGWANVINTLRIRAARSPLGFTADNQCTSPAGALVASPMATSFARGWSLSTNRRNSSEIVAGNESAIAIRSGSNCDSPSQTIASRGVETSITQAPTAMGTVNRRT
jgi:hypothetical protein